MRNILPLLLVLYLSFSLKGYAQSKVISGVVKSTEKDENLPGVTVYARGNPTIGTVTDSEGKFSLSVPDEVTILTFSYIGMTTQEVTIGARTVLEVSLIPDTKQLSEVMVVGYGTQRKVDLTGAISSVSGEQVQSIPVPTFESAIQGKVAGVFIESSSGKLGEAMRIRVRGSSSISASNQPLYVLDGIPITSADQSINNNQPTNPLVDINPNDIESIQVLKDASAGAIYGSRATNGVVLITTKRGKSGKSKINVSYQVGSSRPSNKIGFLNASEYRELYTEATLRRMGIDPVNATAQEKIDAAKFLEDPVDGFGVTGYYSDSLVNTNWEDQAFQKGTFQQVDLSGSGGTEKTQFYAGLTYSDQEGILLGNGFGRISGRLNLDQQVNNKLKIGMGLNLVRTSLDRVANDNAYSTPLQMVALAPVQRTHNPVTNEINTNTIYYNGLIDNRDSYARSAVFRTFGKTYAIYEFFKGFTFNTELGVDLLNQREENYLGRNTQDGAPSGRGESRAAQVFNYSTNNYFSYKNTFNDIHSIDATLGITFQSSENKTTELQAIGFPNDKLPTLNNAAETVSFGSLETGFTYLSYFARLNYQLNSRYLISLSSRIDGSSRFGKDNRYGFFPAISGGWILSEESFLKDNISALNFFKIRASYGITGNSEIADFASIASFQGSNYVSQSGLRPLSLPSPDLKWETTAQVDIGIEFGLFGNRISGEIDYYKKKTSDLLLAKTLAGTSGFTSITRNIGELENKGWEFVINTENLVGEFKWNTSFNIAFNKNRVIKIAGSDIIAPPNRVREGEPLGVFVTRKYAGVDPENGDALYYLKEGSNEKTNNYNLAEAQVVGDPNPDYVGGFTNNFSYKGITLDVLFQFVKGNEIFNAAGTYQSNNASGYLDNQTKDQLKRWRKPGDVTDVPRADLAASIGNAESSRYIYDGSYLRLKTLTLGYNLPSALVNRLAGMNSLRVYFLAQNLLTFTKYKGWDPEVNYTGTGRSTTSTNIVQGYDFYTAPQPKSYTFGINIGF